MALVTSTLAGSPFMSKQEGNALVRGKDIKGTVVVLSKTQPQQLSLFQTFLPADERYSNTIDLYDAIPKYFPKKRLKKERVEGMFLPMLKREFEFKGERFVVKITPAKLETREGEGDFYPSHREELVEEAIRKIASTRLNGIFLNNIAGVQFTLYELKKELKERGHDIDLRELIDSLKICNLTNISVQKDDGKAVMQSAIFPTLLIASKEEWASIMGSATLGSSRWTQRRGRQLHRFQNRCKHRARLLTEKPLRSRRAVRPREEKVVHGG